MDARLRRIEERIYDEGVSGQASDEGGQETDEDNEHGKGGVEDGGCESNELN